MTRHAFAFLFTVAMGIAAIPQTAQAGEVTVTPEFIARAQGKLTGEAVPHQMRDDKGNVGTNLEKGFQFKCFIVFDLGSNLVDLELAKSIQLKTTLQWGGTGSTDGWRYVYLGAYDDAELTNPNVCNWGEADGNRFVEPGTEVGLADPSGGKETFGKEGVLELDVTQALQNSKITPKHRYLWFRVEAVNPQDGGSWGGLNTAEGQTQLKLELPDE